MKGRRRRYGRLCIEVAEFLGRNRFDMSVREMAEILAVEESTFHRYRTGFVYGVAERLGWY